MNRSILIATGALMLSATLATADSFSDKVVADLTSQGFDFIEVKNGISQTKVEAVRSGRKIEVIYDRMTGSILKQEWEPAGDDAGRSGVQVRSENRDFLDRDDRRGDDDDNDDDDRRDRGGDEVDEDDRNDDREDDHDDDRDRDRDRGGDDDDDDRDEDSDDNDDDDEDDDDD